jgi:aquaporin Z
MKKLIAEMIGTATLVFFGCGSVILAATGTFDQLAVSLAFGLAIVAMAYGIGPVSGCHVNPAVSFGAFVAGRFNLNDMIGYVLAQCLGAILGAAVLFVIASGNPAFDLATNGLGQNGYGALAAGGSPGDYSLQAGFVFEVFATFLFLVVILGVTQKGAPSHLAGLAIGLTLAVIHIVGIQVTGVSVNPARSLGPAMFVGGVAVSQLWLFFLAPLIGAGIAGLLFKHRILSADSSV